MQAPTSRGPWQGPEARPPGLNVLGVALAAALVLVMSASAAQQPRPSPKVTRLSQGQTAWQFLRAVMRANYSAAYGLLAPEVHRAVSLERFEAATRPLWKAGQRRGQQIELYKLGVRLGAGGTSRMFYAFTFASDSASKEPLAVLEVTFRDTATRAVLGFALRTTPLAAPNRPPASSSGRNGNSRR